MSLRDEIPPYIDGNGLVAPGPVTPGTIRGSDNGVMYTSEYYALLSYRNEKIPGTDFQTYSALMSKCLNKEHMLCRAPGATDQDSIDNHLGFFHGCRVMGCQFLPQLVIEAFWKYWGFMNNENPGKWTLDSFMFRFPQLIACAYSAARKPYWFLFPFYWYAALCILWAARKIDKGDADARRLTWHLAHTVCPDSWLCRQAAKAWLNRVESDWGPDGVRACVEANYYSPGHPLKKYWTTVAEDRLALGLS